MQRLMRGVFCVMLAGLAGAADAIDDHILFSQDATGAVTGKLVGIIDACKGSHYFPMGVPSVVLAAREYDITSMFAIIDPPPCPDVPAPYEVTASLGTVADGHYAAVWTVGGVVVTATFSVNAGVLLAASPVPTLSPPVLAGLSALVLLAAFVSLRRMRSG